MGPTEATRGGLIEELYQNTKSGEGKKEINRGRTDGLPAEPLHTDDVVYRFQSHTLIALHVVTALSVCRALPQARYRGPFLPLDSSFDRWVVIDRTSKGE